MIIMKKENRREERRGRGRRGKREEENKPPPSLPFTAGMIDLREVLFWSYHCPLFPSKSTYAELGHFISITAGKDGPNCLANFSHHPLCSCISHFSKMYFAGKFPVSHADTEFPMSSKWAFPF